MGLFPVRSFGSAVEQAKRIPQPAHRQCGLRIDIPSRRGYAFSCLALESS